MFSVGKVIISYPASRSRPAIDHRQSVRATWVALCYGSHHQLLGYSATPIEPAAALPDSPANTSMPFCFPLLLLLLSVVLVLAASWALQVKTCGQAKARVPPISNGPIYCRPLRRLAFLFPGQSSAFAPSSVIFDLALFCGCLVQLCHAFRESPGPQFLGQRFDLFPECCFCSWFSHLRLALLPA